MKRKSTAGVSDYNFFNGTESRKQEPKCTPNYILLMVWFVGIQTRAGATKAETQIRQRRQITIFLMEGMRLREICIVDNETCLVKLQKKSRHAGISYL